MEYVTVKTAVHAHYEDVAQEFYRYEIISRWWPSKDKQSFEWKHTIIRIDRDGTVIPLEQFSLFADGTVSGWWQSVIDYLAKQPMSHPYEGYTEGRLQFHEQHRYLIQMCVG